MKKIRSLAFSALVTPVLMLSSGALLAQQSSEQDATQSNSATTQSESNVTGAAQSDSQQSSDQDATQSNSSTAQSDSNLTGAAQSDSQKAANQGNMGAQKRAQHRGYIDSTPANSMRVSDLIGADVVSTGGESIGPVDDVIFDQNGQAVAIVIGVGGFLGLGEKRVAIGWDDVRRSGSSDKMELRIDATRKALSSAPEFEKQD